MINYLDIKTPAQGEAGAVRSDYGLDHHGLAGLGTVYWNLPAPSLYEEIVFRREGRVVMNGPVVMSTGKHTGRAASDKFIVREPDSEGHVWWGQYNRPFATDKFDASAPPTTRAATKAGSERTSPESRNIVPRPPIESKRTGLLP